MFFREQVMRQTLCIDPNEKRAGLTYRELLAQLDALFEFGEEQTRDFFANVFWLTVLDKIRAPEGALSRQWMTPGGW